MHHGLHGDSPLTRDPVVIRAALGVRSTAAVSVRVCDFSISTEDQEGIREIRVNIVKPDKEQLAEYEASDREAPMVERNAKFNQELTKSKQS